MSLDLGALEATVGVDPTEFRQGLDRAEGQMHRFRNEVEDIADATSDAVDRELAVDGQELEESLDEQEGRFKKFGSRMMAASAVAGAAIGAALMAALVEAMDMQQAEAELAAGLGDADFAHDMGKVAGQLYADGWGESLRDNMTAVQAIWSAGLVDEDATGEAIGLVTSQAQALAQVLGIEVPDAANYAQVILKARLAKDSTEAFDLILAGSRQVPMSLREDFLEATQEYGQFFGALGFTGSQAFEALAAASDKGTFGIDKMGDAVKEFTLLSTDVDAAGEAYKAIGLDAKTTANDLLAGGDRANAAFFKIVAGLAAITDPAEQAKQAIAFFGTPLEDMNKAEIPEFLNSLSKAKDGIGDFKGETQEAADALGSSASAQFDSFKRTVQMAIVEQVAKAVPYLTDLAKWGSKNKEWIEPVVTVLGALAIVIGVVAAAQMLWNLALMISPIGWIIIGIVALVATFVILYQKVEWFRDAVNAIWGAIVAGAQLWWSAVQVYWEFIKGAFLAWLRLFLGTWSMIFDGVGAAVGWIVDKWNWLVEFVTGIPGKIRKAAAGMWDGVKDAFRSALNWLISKWNGLSLSIPSVDLPLIGRVGGFTLRTAQIPYLAVGGDITRTGMAVVHAGERVVPAAQAERIRDGGPTGVKKIVLVGTGFLSWLREEISAQGGDVQVVLGGAP